jgi:polyribonucleotide nucleotidyltransferase
MDFKVAGTRDFVTALQLDTKIDGLPADVLREALLQARDARLKILDVMDAEISTHRGEVKPTAPKIISFEIPMDKIGEVIGPKGKVINTITQETGADVSVSDDGVVGTVSIGSNDGAAVEEAKRRIELILDPPTAELGAEYTGKVVNVTKFGAFVNVLPGRDGLLHISKLGRGKRIDRVEDVLNLGDEVTVRVDDIDNSGKLSLSLAGDEPEPSSSTDTTAPSTTSSNGGARESRAPRNESARDSAGDADVASFDDAWDSQARAEFGDLGPAEVGRPGGDRGGERRGGGGGGRRRGGGGGRR